MLEFDLRGWLQSHSVSSKQVGDEIIFSHSTGHTSCLVIRETWRDDVLNPESAFLREFYESILGASIGDGQIIIATPVVGGLKVSHDFRIPDLEELANKSKELGMPLPGTHEVFIMEASWMFLYAIDRTSGADTLLRYDRDFKSIELMSKIDLILGRWWEMVTAEIKE